IKNAADTKIIERTPYTQEDVLYSGRMSLNHKGRPSAYIPVLRPHVRPFSLD
ncbi:Hypothetical protein EIN_465530, partial [Entamoeba invadens IP1]